jgi:glycosyltransferase involved in cell wall biosynthesis
MGSAALRVTLALIAYNQEPFIGEAIHGALSQTFEPLEILISDDCSTDGTYAAMARAVQDYVGPHAVRLNCNDHNLGLAGHLNQVMVLAQGQLIVIAAGDDISLPERVAKIVLAYESSKRQALSLYSNALKVNAAGEPEGLYMQPPEERTHDVVMMASRLGGVLGSTHAWDRRVFEVFGPLDERVTREDAVIPFRSALLGKIQFLPEPLVLYRRHGTNSNFIDPRDIMSAELFYADSRKHAVGNQAVFENRLKDLDTLERLEPQRSAEVADLRSASLHMLRDMEIEARLFTHSGKLANFVAIMQALGQGTPPKRIVKWLLISFAPRLYLMIQIQLRHSAQRRTSA